MSPILLLLVLSIATECSATDRLLPHARDDRRTHRRLQAAPQDAVITVGDPVDSRPFALAHRIFGGYRSEEKDHIEEIYRPDRTLAPLNMPSNRLQIALNDAELGPDGTYLDPQDSQGKAIRLSAASVTSEIFVTVGYPWSTQSQEYIADWERPEGQKKFGPNDWEAHWLRTYNTLADALVGRYWTGKPVWVEIFGEPDLADWWWVYGRDRGRVFRAAQLAYAAFARYPGRLVVGGCGFAYPESQWAADFLDFSVAAGLRFGFFSFHHYLAWNDQYALPWAYPWPAGAAVPGTPFTGEQLDLGWRVGRLRAAMAARGLGGVPIVLSEYGWQDPDLVQSAGFGDAPSRSGRVAMSHHHSCARTLEAIQLVVAEPAIVRAFWAQGVGQVFEPWWEYSSATVAAAGGRVGVAAVPAGPGSGPGGGNGTRVVSAALLGLLGGASQAWVRVQAAATRKNNLFSYDPFVVYRQDIGNEWRYKSSYYAFWWLGRIEGARLEYANRDAGSLGVWAARSLGRLWIAVWNKRGEPRWASLALPPDVRGGWACRLYRVDDQTFQLSSADPLDAVISGPASPIPPAEPGVGTVDQALQFLSTRPLGPEATLFLEIEGGGAG